MLYLALTVISLHLLVLPIVFGADIFVDSDKRTGKITFRLFGIPVFIKRLDYEALRKRLFDHEEETDSDPKPESDNGKSNGLKSKFKAFLVKVAIEILKLICVVNMDLNAKIGAGDAAITAVTVGGMQIAYSQVCAFIGYRDCDLSKIKPDYNSECINIAFVGIFSLNFADIIYALCAVISKKIFQSISKRRTYANTVAKRTTRTSD